eukprot:scaffold2330_cov41-Prasinocladus_malaysianus.AAC.1
MDGWDHRRLIGIIIVAFHSRQLLSSQQPAARMGVLFVRAEPRREVYVARCLLVSLLGCAGPVGRTGMTQQAVGNDTATN